MSDFEIAIDPETASPGYAVLAYEDEDGRYVVNGVAIGNGDITQGMSGMETVWPAETLQDAAELLVGTPITAGTTDQAHPGAEKDESGLSVDETAPDESVIGEVTKARWDEALGLLWQGTITDESVAEGVERGEIDVSPVVARDVEPLAAESDAADGSDGDGDGSTDGQPDRWEATAIHGFRDLTVLPPSVPGAAPSNAIEPGVAEALAAAFDEPAEPGTDRDADPDPDDLHTDTIMSEIELTDKEHELLSVIRQADDPTVIESEDADKLPQAEALLSEADAIDGEPKLVAEAEYETLSEHVAAVESMMDEALVAQRDLKETTVEAMSFEAKAAEFEADDGGLNAEALVQSPETGAVTPDEEEAANTGAEALSADEREEVELLVTQAERMAKHAPDFAAERRSEAAEALALDVEEPSLDELKEAL